MLLQQIVESLDTELDRLHQLREIVAGLRRTSSGGARAKILDIVARAEEPVAAAEPAETPVRTAKVRRAPREKVVRRRGGAVEPTALTAAIPKAPVVVSAAALAREHAARQGVVSAAKPKLHEPEPGSLASMIRALRLEGAL